jgi:serine/threonine protein kinase
VADEVVLGRYQIIKHLASGGMAQVLLARATGIEGFERHVVIKRIHRERANNEQVVRMFLDEARLAAMLHHHNIVQVHDIGQENGEYFFVMEYVHGEDLRRLLTHLSAKKATMPIEHVLTIIMETAEALQYAHEVKGPNGKPLNLVHRDVSPANVIVGYDGNVKVVDFGIAKASVRSSETQSGMLKGKISYMAPEQCLGEPVDRRSDVFALGICLFELFTVRRLFKGPSEFLTMTSIVQGNIPKPSAYRPDIPPKLEEIIMKALAMEPEQRYQSAEEMRLALKAFAAEHNLQCSRGALSDYMTIELGRRQEPWLIEDDEAEIEIVDVDFDGSASGAAGVADRHLTPPPGSLLARARRKLAAAKGIPIVALSETHRATTAGDVPPAIDFSPTEKPGTGSVTPLGWAMSGEQAAPSRKKWMILGAIGLPVAIIATVIATRSSASSDAVRAPAAATIAPAPPAPPPAPVTPPPAPPAPPAPDPTVAPATAPQTVADQAPAPKKHHSDTKKSTKPKQTWDPHALFLNKKP